MASAYISYEQLKLLAVVSAGATTDIKEQESALEAGASFGAGVVIPTTHPSATKTDVAVMPDGTIVALFDLLLRRDPSTYTAEVIVTAVDDTSTYTVTLGGTPVSYAAVANDGAEEILNALALAIPVAIPTIYDVVVEGSDDDGWSLFISLTTGRAPFTATVGATATGAMEVAVDATSITYEIWTRLGAGVDATWRRVTGETAITATENVGDRLDLAGYSAVDLRVITSNGRVRRVVRPGVYEVTA